MKPREHSGEHEELLATLLAGERRPEEPEVARALRECPLCREQWSLLRGTAKRIEREAADRRAILDELERVAPAPGEENVLRTLERLAAEDATARRGRPRFAVWLAASVLLVAGAWLGWQLRGAGERRDPAWLGSQTLRLTEPLEEVPSFERFAWTYAGDDAASFTLRIYPEESGADGEAIVEREGLKESTWTPEAELLKTLPSRIRWRVDALDELRAVLTSASASARLSSR